MAKSGRDVKQRLFKIEKRNTAGDKHQVVLMISRAVATRTCPKRARAPLRPKPLSTCWRACSRTCAALESCEPFHCGTPPARRQVWEHLPNCAPSKCRFTFVGVSRPWCKETVVCGNTVKLCVFKQCTLYVSCERK